MITIGERLKQARWQRGYSQQTVADQVGVTKQAISKYERGEDVPSSGVLLRLSQTLDVRPDFFFRQNTVTVGSPVYRHKRSLRRDEERAIQAQVNDWLERYLELEELAGVAPLAQPVVPDVKRRHIADLAQVEAAADDLRGRWELGLDAIENLTEVLEDKGIKVHLVDAIDAFDALTFPVGKEAVIASNRNQPTDRLRFSLAHELGHLFLNPVAGIDAEKAANRFAGAFLVPQDTARRELGARRQCLDLRELILLRGKYGLSVQAWIHRAQDLEILSVAATTRQFSELERLGARDLEIGPKLPPEEPRRMELLVRRALAEDLISRSRAAELLGMSLAEFHAKELVDADGARAMCG